MHLFHKLASHIGCRTAFKTPQLQSPDVDSFKRASSAQALSLRKSMLLDVEWTDDFIYPVVAAVATNINILKMLEPTARLSECVAQFSLPRPIDTSFAVDGGVTVFSANIPPSVVALPAPAHWPRSAAPWSVFRGLDASRLEFSRPDATPVVLRYSTDAYGVVTMDFADAGLPLNFRARFASEFLLTGCRLHIPWRVFPWETFNTAAISAGAADLLNSYGLLGAFQGAQTQHVTRTALIGAALILDYRHTNG